MIIRNRAKCLNCGDIIESKFRHDFRTCSCGKLSVDGGYDYIRRGFEDRTEYEELSEEWTEKQAKSVGKRLSYLLRHCQEPLYISLNGGWACVDDIMEVLKISREELNAIVREDNKGRFFYDATETKIRANQGHSIPGVIVDMEEPDPPEILYHGTAERFLDSILREGLKPMGREWVHISPDVETAFFVGMRHGNPAILKIRAQDLVADGYRIFRSVNGVWQIKYVPPAYISVLGASDNNR